MARCCVVALSPEQVKTAAEAGAKGKRMSENIAIRVRSNLCLFARGLAFTGKSCGCGSPFLNLPDLFLTYFFPRVVLGVANYPSEFCEPESSMYEKTLPRALGEDRGVVGVEGLEVE